MKYNNFISFFSVFLWYQDLTYAKPGLHPLVTAHPQKYNPQDDNYHSTLSLVKHRNAFIYNLFIYEKLIADTILNFYGDILNKMETFWLRCVEAATIFAVGRNCTGVIGDYKQLLNKRN